MVTTLQKLIWDFLDWKYCPSLCNTENVRVSSASRYCGVTVWENYVIIYYYLQFLIHVFGVQFLILGALCVILVFIYRFFWRKFLLKSFVTNAVLKATSVTVEMLVIFIVIIFLLWRINWCSLCLCWVHNKVFYGLRMVYFLMLILFILHCWIYMCVEFTIFLVKE